MPYPTPTSALLDVAIVAVDDVVIGVTRGGVRRIPGIELRSIEFDGKRSAWIVGQDRVVMFGERAEFTMIELGSQANINRMENVSGVLAPPKAGEIYSSARYLNNVTLTWRTQTGGAWRIRYPKALFQWTEIRGADKSEGEYLCSVEAASNLSVIGLDDAPFVKEFSATGVFTSEPPPPPEAPLGAPRLIGVGDSHTVSVMDTAAAGIPLKPANYLRDWHAVSAKFLYDAISGHRITAPDNLDITNRVPTFVQPMFDAASNLVLVLFHAGTNDLHNEVGGSNATLLTEHDAVVTTLKGYGSAYDVPARVVAGAIWHRLNQGLTAADYETRRLDMNSRLRTSYLAGNYDGYIRYDVDPRYMDSSLSNNGVAGTNWGFFHTDEIHKYDFGISIDSSKRANEAIRVAGLHQVVSNIYVAGPSTMKVGDKRSLVGFPRSSTANWKIERKYGTWATTDAGVCMVNQKGEVTAVGAGSCNITYTVGAIVGTLSITVSAASGGTFADLWGVITNGRTDVKAAIDTRVNARLHDDWCLGFDDPDVSTDTGCLFTLGAGDDGCEGDMGAYIAGGETGISFFIDGANQTLDYVGRTYFGLGSATSTAQQYLVAINSYDNDQGVRLRGFLNADIAWPSNGVMGDRQQIWIVADLTQAVGSKVRARARTFNRSTQAWGAWGALTVINDTTSISALPAFNASNSMLHLFKGMHGLWDTFRMDRVAHSNANIDAGTTGTAEVLFSFAGYGETMASEGSFAMTVRRTGYTAYFSDDYTKGTPMVAAGLSSMRKYDPATGNLVLLNGTLGMYETLEDPRVNLGVDHTYVHVGDIPLETGTGGSLVSFRNQTSFNRERLESSFSDLYLFTEAGASGVVTPDPVWGTGTPRRVIMKSHDATNRYVRLNDRAELALGSVPAASASGAYRVRWGDLSAAVQDLRFFIYISHRTNTTEQNAITDWLERADTHAITVHT